ncbi:ly6/PLAUR domain-containing protein 2-like [Bombina bombina]|uniref:ly6/PLAUR domain-containing protein 2-like n=1 Tax=Bombina bombina TaxID=8345 RepID=UPI00235B187B|nr:ly6/PLAUR domain-containing protein 2-like [Bombina bombina]
MKGFIISILALALCFDLACSLQCYLCPYPTASAECTDTKNCTGTQLLCKTSVTAGFGGYPFQGTELVIRDCAKDCSPSDNDQIGADQLVLCCNNDLCNNRGVYAGGSNSGAETVKNSFGFGLLFCFISIVLSLRTVL